MITKFSSSSALMFSSCSINSCTINSLLLPMPGNRPNTLRARQAREVAGRSVPGGETSTDKTLGETEEARHDFYARVEEASGGEIVESGSEMSARTSGRGG